MFLLSVNIVLRGHHENYDHIINMNVWEQNQSNESNKSMFMLHIYLCLVYLEVFGFSFL